MYKLGRNSRKFNPKIAHMSAILGAKRLPVPPQMIDWTGNIKDFGMMLNDELGDCSCAGIYHALQIWTLNSSKEITESDQSVLALYEAACGYQLNNPATDRGAVLQDVLLHCTNEGFPLSDGKTEKFVGFIEVDPRNIQDVKIAINDFGLVYIGFEVPNIIYDTSGEPLQIWDVKPNSGIEGGHCVILAGYDDAGVTVISWGKIYKMTWEFFQEYVDEVYAILSKDWINISGKTPLGMTSDELASLMNSIKD